jgi:hypothetical protein
MEGSYTPPRELADPVPDAVERVIAGCLQADRERRLQNCAQVLAVLAGDAAGGGDERGLLPTTPSPPLAFQTALPPSISNETLDPSVLAPAEPRPRRVTAEEPVPAAAAGGPRRATRPPSAPDPFATSIELPGGDRARRATWVKIAGVTAVAGGLMILVAGAVVLGAGVFQWQRGGAETEGTAAVAGGAEPAAPVAEAPSSGAPADAEPSIASEPPEADVASVVGDAAAGASSAAPPAIAAPAEGAVNGKAASGASSPTRPAVATERAPAATASVRVTGDAHAVSFKGPGGTHRSGAALAPGSYSIIADFGDGVPTPAGAVTLAAGDEVTLLCSATFFNCQEK